MTIAANQRVRISGEAGTVIGRIEDIRTVDEMPSGAELGVDLPTEGEYEPRNILRELGASRVAAISYHATPNSELLFTALEIDGEWFDLRRNKLTLEVVGVFG